MTKQEFLKNVNDMLPEGRRINTITDKEYSVIETVYAFHPSISEVDGKVEIAELYARFGWSLIMDMEPRAKLMAQKERELSDIKSSMLALQQDMDIVRNGGWL